MYKRKYHQKAWRRSLIWSMGLVRDTVTPASPSSRHMSRVARGDHQTHPPSCAPTYYRSNTSRLHTWTYLHQSITVFIHLLTKQKAKFLIWKFWIQPPCKLHLVPCHSCLTLRCILRKLTKPKRGQTLSDDCCCYIRCWLHFGLGLNQKEVATEWEPFLQISLKDVILPFAQFWLNGVDKLISECRHL